MRNIISKRAVELITTAFRGLLLSKYGRMFLLLFGHCFIRPSDLAPVHSGPTHLKAFDLLAPVTPALFFASVFEALARTFALRTSTEQLEGAQAVAMLQQYFRMEKFIYLYSLVSIVGLCYALACGRFLFHRAMCQLFGQSKTDKKSASFKFFVVKSSILFMWVAVITWLAGYLIPFVTSPDPQSEIAGLADLIQTHIVYVILCAVIIFFAVQICRENSRLAMIEIYPDKATYQNVQAIALLMPVTAIVVLTFLL
jgi:hypothetical protein